MSGHLLGAQREGSAGDGRGQIQSLGDLSPQLLVDDLHQAALLCHQHVQHEQVEHLLRHDGDAVHRCPSLLHETEQVVLEERLTGSEFRGFSNEKAKKKKIKL